MIMKPHALGIEIISNFMETINIQYYKTIIGELIMGSYDGKLCLLDYRYRKMRDRVDSRIKKGINAEFSIKDDEVLQNTRLQLDEYLSGERKNFDIPLLLIGSDFQKSVWNALMEIPYGKTDSYLSLSNKIGNPKAVRAVANANGANAIAVIVPCHRIIGSNGALVGYAGGLDAKKRLLIIENSYKKNIYQQELDL